jgi:hypothetical protein
MLRVRKGTRPAAQLLFRVEGRCDTVSRAVLRHWQTAASCNHKYFHPLCGCDIETVVPGF